MSRSVPTAMEAEFDTMSGWIADALAGFGRDHAIPAACRGSGSPAELGWLADGLDLHGDDRFLDSGAGLGGPAAWLAEHLASQWHGAALLAEPMTHAAAASRRLFGLPSVAAWSQHLPLPDASVCATWSLGVLCTTEDKREVLTELHRVLEPGGRLGILVLVADHPFSEPPEGNDFPTRDSLRADLAATGFRIDDEVDRDDLPAASDAWHRRADEVDEVVRRRHGDRPEWHQAQRQQQILGDLMASGHIATVLLRTTAT